MWFDFPILSPFLLKSKLCKCSVMAIRSFIVLSIQMKIRAWKMNRARFVFVCESQKFLLQTEWMARQRAFARFILHVSYDIRFYFYLVRCWRRCWQHCRCHTQRCRIAAAGDVVVGIAAASTIIIRWFLLFARLPLGLATATLPRIGRCRLWWGHRVAATVNTAHPKSPGECSG